MRWYTGFMRKLSGKSIAWNALIAARRPDLFGQTATGNAWLNILE